MEDFDLVKERGIKYGKSHVKYYKK